MASKIDEFTDISALVDYALETMGDSYQVSGVLGKWKWEENWGQLRTRLIYLVLLDVLKDSSSAADIRSNDLFWWVESWSGDVTLLEQLIDYRLPRQGEFYRDPLKDLRDAAMLNLLRRPEESEPILEKMVKGLLPLTDLGDRNYRDVVYRREVVAALRNSEVLAEIARHGPLHMRSQAVYNPYLDGQVLLDVARHDPDPEVRSQAFGRLDFGDNLELRDEWFRRDKGLAGLMLSRVRDQSLLAEFVWEGDFSQRKEAIENLIDQALLARFAKRHPDPKIRLMAVKKINDPALLVDIYRNGKDGGVRRIARRKLWG